MQVQTDASGRDNLARSRHGAQTSGKFQWRCPCMFKASKRQSLHQCTMHYPRFIFLDIVRVEPYGCLPVTICALFPPGHEAGAYRSALCCTVLHCTVPSRARSWCVSLCTVLYSTVLHCTHVPWVYTCASMYVDGGRDTIGAHSFYPDLLNIDSEG